MNVTGIIIAAAVVGIVGIVIGVLLGIASEKFKVEVDEREELVRAELPGRKSGGQPVSCWRSAGRRKDCRDHGRRSVLIGKNGCLCKM